jgi:hypothetical protein
MAAISRKNNLSQVGRLSNSRLNNKAYKTTRIGVSTKFLVGAIEYAFALESRTNLFKEMPTLNQRVFIERCKKTAQLYGRAVFICKSRC